jgi:hypothetical protein
MRIKSGTYRTDEPQTLAFVTIHAILKAILTQTIPTQTLLMYTYYFGDVLDLGSMNHDINRTPRQIVIMFSIWSYGPYVITLAMSSIWDR